MIIQGPVIALAVFFCRAFTLMALRPLHEMTDRALLWADFCGVPLSELCSVILHSFYSRKHY